MDREELKAELGIDGDHLWLAPIESIVDRLAEEELSGLAVVGCLLRLDEAAPHLLKMVGRAGAGIILTDEDWRLFIRALYILGGGRCEKACRPVLHLASLPGEVLKDLLGTVITEDLNCIVAGVFDGDPEPLFAMIANPSLDEFVRDAIFLAATFLTFEGRIETARMRRFIEHFQDAAAVDDFDWTWSTWVTSIGMLGFEDYLPRVRRAYDERRLDSTMLGFDDFEKDLAAARERPGDVTRFAKANMGYIEDVCEALAWTDVRNGEEQIAEQERPYMPPRPVAPMTNPFRHIGRNDPCPCGSGRKAKKCCLGSGSPSSSGTADE